jgi:hypothetical protein
MTDEKIPGVPLIFFVHVPKTAGSTVNAFLKRQLPGGLDQCQGLIRSGDNLAEEASRRPWLSAHVDSATAETQLKKATDREIRFFSCIREPVRQVASHYNWLIEIYHRGGAFYQRHPANVKAISEALRSSDHSPASIIALLEKYAGLFLNQQARYILGAGFSWNTGLIHQRLDKYEFIADSCDLAPLLKLIGEGPVGDPLMENVSKYHFDVSAFDSPQVRAFLRKRNTLDEILYDLVRRRLEGPPPPPQTRSENASSSVERLTE